MIDHFDVSEYACSSNGLPRVSGGIVLKPDSQHMVQRSGGGHRVHIDRPVENGEVAQDGPVRGARADRLRVPGLVI
jgi:hypothetical protein